MTRPFLVFVALCAQAQTEAELRAHVGFLASDLLEGRATPSRGLDAAALYIATQFEQAGLKPVNGSYFQTAEVEVVEAGKPWSVELMHGARSIRVPSENLFGPMQSAARLEAMRLVKIAAPFTAVPDALRGAVAITDAPASQQTAARILSSGAAAVLFVLRTAPSSSPPARSRTFLPGKVQPVLSIADPAVSRFYESLPAEDSSALASIRIEPRSTRSTVRNVVGLLRGSDAKLGGTYAMLTAHYDHEGIGRNSDGDRVYNGANDNASGVAAVLAIARELAARPEGLARSILFVAFFGEENGLLGSRYYAAHPAAPLRDTVVHLNLEQLGRTDDVEGPRVNKMNVTGFEYSDAAAYLSKAAAPLGVGIENHLAYGDAFFNRSDNEPLALRGVPAHTISVAYQFPDYHRPGDEAHKLDYANFERVSRAITAGLAAIANSPAAPQWNEANPKAAPYRKARGLD